MITIPAALDLADKILERLEALTKKPGESRLFYSDRVSPRSVLDRAVDLS